MNFPQKLGALVSEYADADGIDGVMARHLKAWIEHLTSCPRCMAALALQGEVEIAEEEERARHRH